MIGVKDRVTKHVAARVVTATDAATLQGFVGKHAESGATVYTDDHGGYEGMPFTHATVKHSLSEYVRGDIHTNGIESLWSMLKRAHKGTFHKLSPKHLNRYVQEFASRQNLREAAARQHHVKTASSGPEVTTVKHWLRWSARHKWVSRSLARDEWIARTSDEQIVSNVTACKLALTTRAHDFLTANDGPNFIRAARALSMHVPPIQRVADVSERIEDLSDVPDATREERRAIRDAARQKNEETPETPWRDHSPECCGVAVVLLWFYGAGPGHPPAGIHPEVMQY